MGGLGVEPHGLHYFYKAYISQPNEGHVAPNHWATCPLLIRFQYDTCQHVTGQRTSNQSVPPHQYTTSSWWYDLPRGRTDCTDRYSQHPNFDLFDLTEKSWYLLHMDSVCESKYTVGISKMRRTQWHCFHHIPSTLKIEQILIPWSLAADEMPEK